MSPPPFLLGPAAPSRTTDATRNTSATLGRFFSDEPQFGNQLIGPHRVDPGFYERRIGQEGLALPYNAEVLRRMSEEMGTDAAPYLGELWYESPHSHITRLAYMNAVTRLYRECLVQPIAAWCRERGRSTSAT